MNKKKTGKRVYLVVTNNSPAVMGLFVVCGWLFPRLRTLNVLQIAFPLGGLVSICINIAAVTDHQYVCYHYCYY